MSFGKNYNIFEDLNQLKRMVDSLKGYLHSDQLYGSIGGGMFTGGNAPNLTVGAIQLRLRRLMMLSDMLNDKQKQTLANAQQKHADLQDETREQYEKKMLREAISRLDAMGRFFEECAEDPKMCPRIYNPEAYRRTVVQALVGTMDELGVQSEDVSQKLQQTDHRLRGFLSTADFLWDDQLRDVYPKDPYWWLWMAPPRLG